MCKAFQTGGVRFASQKSWLVAAIRNSTSSANTPKSSNGNWLTLSRRGLLLSTLTSGLASPSA